MFIVNLSVHAYNDSDLFRCLFYISVIFESFVFFPIELFSTHILYMYEITQGIIDREQTIETTAWLRCIALHIAS